MSSIPAKKSLVSPGRKPMISREDIIAAALKLLGPSRSVSTLSLREVAREAVPPLTYSFTIIFCVADVSLVVNVTK